MLDYLVFQKPLLHEKREENVIFLCFDRGLSTKNSGLYWSITGNNSS